MLSTPFLIQPCNNLDIATICIQYWRNNSTSWVCFWQKNGQYNRYPSIAYNILFTVFFCQEGRLMRTPGTFTLLRFPVAPFHLTNQIFIGFIYYMQFQITIINQYIAIHLEVMHKAGVRYGTFTGCLRLGLPTIFNAITNLIRNRFTARDSSCTHFRYLCIHQYSNAIGNPHAHF